MRIQFVQSGGFLGAVKGCELDTATLAPKAAQELQKLIEASGISASTKAYSNSGRDLQQYEITIEDGKRKVSVEFDDSTVPQAAKSLVGFLKKCATPQPLE